MDRTLNKSYAGRVCRSMTYVSSLSHGIWGKFLSALFCKYSTLSLLTGPQPTCVQGSKILGWSSTLSIIWLWRVWLRIWGVFKPRLTYGVTLWSGVWGAGLTLLGGRWAGPLTYYGSLSSLLTHTLPYPQTVNAPRAMKNNSYLQIPWPWQTYKITKKRSLCVSG